MVTQVKCILVLLLLSIIGMGPIPVTSTIGIIVVIFKPAWFKRVVDELYSN